MCDVKFDIRVSVHGNTTTNCIKKDTKFFEFISTDALHFSGGSSAHHQEHNTVRTASGIVKPILLPAAIVDEMKLEFHLIHDSEMELEF